MICILKCVVHGVGTSLSLFACEAVHHIMLLLLCNVCWLLVALFPCQRSISPQRQVEVETLHEVRLLRVSCCLFCVTLFFSFFAFLLTLTLICQNAAASLRGSKENSNFSCISRLAFYNIEKATLSVKEGLLNQKNMHKQKDGWHYHLKIPALACHDILNFTTSGWVSLIFYCYI